MSECPICLETTTEACRPFCCAHAVCRLCDARMRVHNCHRCPLCRAAREGVVERPPRPFVRLRVLPPRPVLAVDGRRPLFYAHVSLDRVIHFADDDVAEDAAVPFAVAPRRFRLDRRRPSPLALERP